MRDDELDSSDLWLCAFAYANGVKVRGARELTQRGYVALVLDDKDGGATAAQNEWLRGAATVNGRALASAYRHVCSLVRGYRHAG